MHSWRPASWITPARLALMTAVGPPDWATKRLPTSSAIICSVVCQFCYPFEPRVILILRPNRLETLPIARDSVKEEFAEMNNRPPLTTTPNAGMEILTMTQYAHPGNLSRVLAAGSRRPRRRLRQTDAAPLAKLQPVPFHPGDHRRRLLGAASRDQPAGEHSGQLPQAGGGRQPGKPAPGRAGRDQRVSGPGVYGFGRV